MLVLYLDRHSEVEQELDDVGAIPPRRREDRFRRLQILRVFCEYLLRFRAIEPETRRGKRFDPLKRNRGGGIACLRCFARVFTFGVPGAGEELSVTTAFERHDTAAFIANFIVNNQS